MDKGQKKGNLYFQPLDVSKNTPTAYSLEFKIRLFLIVDGINHEQGLMVSNRKKIWHIYNIFERSSN